MNNKNQPKEKAVLLDITRISTQTHLTVLYLARNVRQAYYQARREFPGWVICKFKS